MRLFCVALLVAMLAITMTFGCSQASREGQGPGAGESSSSSQERQEKTSEGEEAVRTEARDAESVGAETTEAEFSVAPEMDGGSEGAAGVIEEVTFERRDGYERAVIVFGNSGAASFRVPVWSLSSPDGEGYARITFPNLGATLDSEGGIWRVYNGELLCSTGP